MEANTVEAPPEQRRGDSMSARGETGVRACQSKIHPMPRQLNPTSRQTPPLPPTHTQTQHSSHTPPNPSRTLTWREIRNSAAASSGRRSGQSAASSASSAHAVCTICERSCDTYSDLTQLCARGAERSGTGPSAAEKGRVSERAKNGCRQCESIARGEY